MKKQLRKFAMAAVFAMVVSLLAPAAQDAVAAEKKHFTYAEQNTGEQVTTLVMKPGEKIDLKFIGVSDWKSYTRKWTSSNEKAAVVDSNGLITAMSKGVTTIKLNIGDGSVYTSAGVVVHVVDELNQEVVIGTSSKEEIKSYTMEMGQSVVLKANGLADNVAGRYTCDWSSTDTTVARISDDGVITTVAPGLTVIQLTVTRVASGEKMVATPIALLVKGQGASADEPTPTPTKKPSATVTPVATATPTPTPVVELPEEDNIPTPTPAEEYVAYSAKLESDNCLLLTFSKEVNYDIQDIQLFKLMQTGSTVTEIGQHIKDVKLSENGRELRIYPSESFEDKEKYLVKAGAADTDGKTINANIGLPARIELSYNCMGTERAAYAYDEEIGIDVPVNLTYKIYTASGIDVTETYQSRGYMDYEFTTDKYDEYASIAGDTINFDKAGVSVSLRAVFTYQDDNENSKEIKTTAVITSKKLPPYSIKGVIKYTVINASNTEKINWEKLDKEIIAGTSENKLVVLIADSYGNYYTNDERGVDAENNIFLLEDYDKLFSQFGYDIEFKEGDKSVNNKLVTDQDGYLYPLEKGNGVVVVELTNNGLNGISDYSKDIGACSVRILAESQLSSMSIKENKVTIAGMALPGFEDRFCEKEVEILLEDQYDKEWTGDYELELSCSLSAIDSALDGSSSAPAYLDGTTLHINATRIKELVPNKSSITLKVKEESINKTISVNVTLEKPTLSNGDIVVKGWSLGMKEVFGTKEEAKISMSDLGADNTTLSASVEAYKLSSNGVEVGLFEDLYVLDTTNYKFTTTNCKEGEVYVYVLGPDGKVLDKGSQDTLGAYHDYLNNCIKVNVVAPVSEGSLVLDTLAPGKYTVKATYIKSVGSTVKTETKTTYFTVEDNTQEIKVRNLKSNKTSLTVSGKDDLAGIKEIIANLFVFTLNGKQWTDFSEDNIIDVKYDLNRNTVVIRSITFAVPVDEDSELDLSYKKLVQKINKAVLTGVDED